MGKGGTAIWLIASSFLRRDWKGEPESDRLEKGDREISQLRIGPGVLYCLLDYLLPFMLVVKQPVNNQRPSYILVVFWR